MVGTEPSEVSILKSCTGLQYALADGFTADCLMLTVISTMAGSQDSDRCSVTGSDQKY